MAATPSDLLTPGGPEPQLSVVITTYNQRHLLETCLASIARHRPHHLPIEVIVSDNGSAESPAGWLRQRHPDVRLVRREQNGGFVAGANQGIQAARAPVLQLLNNDTEVTAGWVEAGLRPFDDPRVGSVSPLVLVRSDPSRVDSAGDRYSLLGWPCKRGHGEPASRWLDREPGSVFAASGSSAFFRTEAIRAVGGFDPAFGSYYEDVDLAFRLRWAGYECVFAPDCRILHEVSATFRHSRPELQRQIARNAELLFWGNLPPGRLVAAIGPHLAFILAQAAHRALTGRLSPFLRGKLDAVKAIPHMRRQRAWRAQLAAAAPRPPHFPVDGLRLEDLANHLRRPRRSDAPPAAR